MSAPVTRYATRAATSWYRRTSSPYASGSPFRACSTSSASSSGRPSTRVTCTLFLHRARLLGSELGSLHAREPTCEEVRDRRPARPVRRLRRPGVVLRGVLHRAARLHPHARSGAAFPDERMDVPDLRSSAAVVRTD